MAHPFFKSKVALVLDENSASRGRIARALGKMGVASDHVHRVGSWGDAKPILEVSGPSVIIADYKIGNKYGLDLSRDPQFCEIPDFSRMFVLCAGSATEAAVAEAAEGDVDAFLLKPFTQAAIEEALKRTAEAKNNPSPYKKLVSLAKSELAKGNHEVADKALKKALTLDPKPVMAYCLSGRSAELKGNDRGAESFYIEGLKCVPNHYRCLTSLFDLFERTGKSKNAFDVLKTLVTVFPVSGTRIGKAIRLAVHSGNLNDIPLLYQKYLELTERSPELVRMVSSSLVLLGKKLIQSGQFDQGREFFKNAITSSGRADWVVFKCVEVLIELGKTAEAEEMFRLIDSGSIGSPDYRSADLLISLAMDDSEQTLKKVRAVIASPVEHASVYRAIANFALKNNLDEVREVAETRIAELSQGNS